MTSGRRCLGAFQPSFITIEPQDHATGRAQRRARRPTDARCRASDHAGPPGKIDPGSRVGCHGSGPFEDVNASRRTETQHMGQAQPRAGDLPGARLAAQVHDDLDQVGDPRRADRVAL